MQVGIVFFSRRKTTIWLLTSFHIIRNLISVHFSQSIHYIHCLQAPIDTAHSKIFCSDIFIRFFVFDTVVDEIHVLCK
uniref:Secreted protein n=1 Tax=Brugia timori TaxID=42155 RepID=A0A0R3QBT3_9BILA